MPAQPTSMPQCRRPETPSTSRTGLGCPQAQRIGAVQRLIDEFGRRAEEMAQTISSENGAPIKFSRLGQVGAPMDIMASTIEVAVGIPIEERRSGRYSNTCCDGSQSAWWVPSWLGTSLRC